MKDNTHTVAFAQIHFCANSFLCKFIFVQNHFCEYNPECQKSHLPTISSPFVVRKVVENPTVNVTQGYLSFFRGVYSKSNKVSVGVWRLYTRILALLRWYVFSVNIHDMRTRFSNLLDGDRCNIFNIIR